MRLLHVRELRLEEFSDGNVPRYAILSHRWGPDEVSYQDFIGGLKKNGAGYEKILKCCEYAATDIVPLDMILSYETVRMSDILEWWQLCVEDWVWVETLDWVWIDTCCIDKSSSAELSEAINSMYNWYAESSVCYAYLSDVTKHECTNQTMNEFRESKWFQRGWTLQELLAPKDLVFLDQDWKELGPKLHLLADVANATGISKDRLELGHGDIASGVSVAERFSWAAGRVTMRVEDRTYCLLGLFDTNLPLLYGERFKAFLRLQLEIIRSSNDESVFVWQNGPVGPLGLVARYPIRFRSQFSGVKGEYSKIEGLQRPPYAITNQGLQFHVPTKLTQQSSFLFPLNCRHYEGGKLKGVYAICVEKDQSSGIWWRSPAECIPDGLIEDDKVYSLNCTGGFPRLFIVPTSWVWSVDDLAKTDSEVIYVRI